MTRPVPRVSSETRPFWDGCADRQLRYQVCSHCRAIQIIPRSLCIACQRTDLEWKVSSGRGVILSFTTVHRAPTPAFRAEAPYVIALVDMDEGFRLMVNVKDGATQDLAIDQPVQIGFVEIEGVVLPQAELVA